MRTEMELLLHYVWQQKLWPSTPLATTDGQPVDIIDPGLHNRNAGPDFFNAKIKIGDTLWAGNVEIHEKAADWFAHRHHLDPAYNNTILHVVGSDGAKAATADGRTLPQLVLPVPAHISQNYKQLLEEEKYPPCYKVIPSVAPINVHRYLSALAVERLEEKTLRIGEYLQRTGGDWERAAFIALARGFGFGTNADAFEQWALGIEPQAIGKHRDNLLQVEAFFIGQAGLLDGAQGCEDEYFRLLKREYDFLKSKFSLTPMDATRWRLMRLRPQNFPIVRLSQLAALYHKGATSLSRIVETPDADGLRSLFRTAATDYWQDHYHFGHASPHSSKTLQAASLDLLLINVAAPLLFAYGRYLADEALCERAFALLESIKPEKNFITRSWAAAGIAPQHAADSQALFRLKMHYCDRKDCLRCAFGAEYLRAVPQP